METPRMTDNFRYEITPPMDMKGNILDQIPHLAKGQPKGDHG